MPFPTHNGPNHRQIAGFIGSRTRDGNDKRTIEWLVTGVADANAAEAYLIGQGLPEPTIEFTPPGALSSKYLKLDSYEWREAVEGNERAYIFTAEYSFEKLDVDEWTLSVSTSGGSIRITNSFGTTSHAATGATAPDFNSAIDVKDGRANGIDRVLPAIKYTLNYRLTRPVDPILYSDIASEITGTTNQFAYFGSQPGELLFLGMDGNFGNQKNPEIQFSWAKSKNAQFSIGAIANVAKKGHDYVWVLYDDEDTGSGANAFTVSKPRAAYVERIYTEADHSVLGLLI